MSFAFGFPLCYFLSLAVMNPNKGKFKGKEILQHIIAQIIYGVGTDLICLQKSCVKCYEIDNPLEYARLYHNNEMQIFIDAEDSLDI